MIGDAWGGSWGDAWGGSWGGDIDTAAPMAGGPDAAFGDMRTRSDQERIRLQNDLIMMTVIAAVAGGMLR